MTDLRNVNIDDSWSKISYALDSHKEYHRRARHPLLQIYTLSKDRNRRVYVSNNHYQAISNSSFFNSNRDIKLTCANEPGSCSAIRQCCCTKDEFQRQDCTHGRNPPRKICWVSIFIAFVCIPKDVLEFRREAGSGGYQSTRDEQALLEHLDCDSCNSTQFLAVAVYDSDMEESGFLVCP